MRDHLPETPRYRDLLTAYVPGHRGYSGHGDDRRATDRALREAVVLRLDAARVRLENLIRACAELDGRDALAELHTREGVGPHRMADSNALTEIHARAGAGHHLATEIEALERINAHRSRVADRLRATSHAAGPVNHERIEALLAVDHDLVERAETLLQRFDQPDAHHDFLAEIEADLTDLDQKLDQRAALWHDLG